MQRGQTSVAAVGGALPLAPRPAQLLQPVYLVRIAANEPWLLERPMMDDEKPSRRLLPPGTYRVTHNIVIEGELTLEQLQQLFVPAQATMRVQLPAAAPEVPEVSPEELERRRRFEERGAQLARAYAEQLGEGPNFLPDSIVSWLKEGWTEEELRSAMVEARSARDFADLSKRERYEYMREVLRVRRRGRT